MTAATGSDVTLAQARKHWFYETIERVREARRMLAPIGAHGSLSPAAREKLQKMLKEGEELETLLILQWHELAGFKP